MPNNTVLIAFLFFAAAMIAIMVAALRVAWKRGPLEGLFITFMVLIVPALVVYGHLR